MEEGVYTKLQDNINFNCNKKIDKIYDIKYADNYILFLFSSNNDIFLLGYNNIDKKILFLKSKTIDKNSLLTPTYIKISMNYVIIISEMNSPKKILAKITIWEYLQDISYCFQTDFYTSDNYDIFNNYIVINSLIGQGKNNNIYIYNIIPFDVKNNEKCNMNINEKNSTELRVQQSPDKNQNTEDSSKNNTNFVNRNTSLSVNSSELYVSSLLPQPSIRPESLRSNNLSKRPLNSRDSNKNSIFDNLIVISCNNKKTINLNKNPVMLGIYKYSPFNFINIDKSSSNLNTFPDISIILQYSVLVEDLYRTKGLNLFIFKYNTKRNGYNFNKEIFVENTDLFIINSIIYDNKIFLLGHHKIDKNILFRIIDINNISSINTIVLDSKKYSSGIENKKCIKIINDNIFILFNSMIYIIKNNSISDLLSINEKYFIFDINKENKNIIVSNIARLNFSINEYKYSIYPIISSVVDNNFINNINKKKYINKILSNFIFFKNYILENNLIEEGLSENDFNKFNYQDIFKNVKKFVNNILKYIKSLPNDDNIEVKKKIKNNLFEAVQKYHSNSPNNNLFKNFNNTDVENFKVQEIYKKFIYQYITYINKLFTNISKQINYGYDINVIITRGNEIQDILTFIQINGIKKIRIT